MLHAICKYCQISLNEQHIIETDYFQTYGANAPVYTLCGACYLKEVDKYLQEQKPCCTCGALEIRLHDDAETIAMAEDEGLLNLICSDLKQQIAAGKISDEELEVIEQEETHTTDCMLYIRDVPDEMLIWGNPDL